MIRDRTAFATAESDRTSVGSEDGISRRDGLTLAAAGLIAPLLPTFSFAQTRVDRPPEVFGKSNTIHFGGGDTGYVGCPKFPVNEVRTMDRFRKERELSKCRLPIS
jgi:hypothetical protein